MSFLGPTEGGLQDALEVAEQAGVGLCLDISGFFGESHLVEKLAAGYDGPFDTSGTCAHRDPRSARRVILWNP